MPEYEGRIAFVEAITTDSLSADVLARYRVTGIPTSVFVDADGEAAETFIGPIDAGRLRAKLDALLVATE
jgi:thiol:disulfide interchange protein